MIPAEPGWYVLSPAGWAGPYPSAEAAYLARPPGQRWPVRFIDPDVEDDAP